MSGSGLKSAVFRARSAHLNVRLYDVVYRLLPHVDDEQGIPVAAAAPAAECHAVFIRAGRRERSAHLHEPPRGIHDENVSGGRPRNAVVTPADRAVAGESSYLAGAVLVRERHVTCPAGIEAESNLITVAVDGAHAAGGLEFGQEPVRTGGGRKMHPPAEGRIKGGGDRARTQEEQYGSQRGGKSHAVFHGAIMRHGRPGVRKPGCSVP